MSPMSSESQIDDPTFPLNKRSPDRRTKKQAPSSTGYISWKRDQYRIETTPYACAPQTSLGLIRLSRKIENQRSIPTEMESRECRVAIVTFAKTFAVARHTAARNERRERLPPQAIVHCRPISACTFPLRALPLRAATRPKNLCTIYVRLPTVSHVLIVDGYQLTVFTVMPRQSIDKRARGADV